MVSTYFLNLIAGNVFGSKLNPAIPSSYFIGLSSSAPSLDGTGAVEPSSLTGYSRTELENLGQPVNGVVTNAAAISFNESSANWGTMTHFVIFDAATDGNLLMYDPLPAPRSIENATIVTIKAGSLKLNVQNIE